MKNDNVLTQKDIVKIIACLNLNYTENYGNYGEEETRELIEYWFESLKAYPRGLVMEAVRKAIEKSEFVPKLSTIIREIEVLESANKASDEELWAELTAVLPRVFDISRYLAYPQHVDWANGKLKEIYDGLSQELKLFAVNVSTLIEIASMPTENLQFERSRFFRQMPVLRKHGAAKNEAAKLLEQVSLKSLPLPSEDNK